MIELQMLNYVLAKKDINILSDNNITVDYFPTYSEEYRFIKDHYDRYNTVPDIETFISNFQKFEILQVSESERYLVDTIREEYLFAKSVPIIKKAANLLKVDANEASKYLQVEMINLAPNYNIPTCDIVHSDSRFNTFVSKSENPDDWFIPTGFQELDDILYGWQCGEEFIVVVARTGQGKSWFLVKTMEHSWLMGKNVGYISPEMSADKLGYRFDTIYKNISNTALLKGDTSIISADEYKAYINELKTRDNKFLVSTPADFNNEITVSKLRSYIKSNKLDILAVDGITYLSDERYKRGDNKTTSLTNISEDLMKASVDLRVPIIIVVQANREGVKDDDNSTPDIENIRDSDGISHNATKILSLRQKDETLIIQVKKNRDSKSGQKLSYIWDIDNGKFEFLPSDTEPVKRNNDEEVKPHKKREGKVVF